MEANSIHELPESVEDLISGWIYRLAKQHSFFSTLALFAKCEYSNSIPTAGTDGRKILISREFFSSLSRTERDGVLMHELLHMALLHALPKRIGGRDRVIWNIAADIVVNGIIRNDCPHLELPKGALLDSDLEHLAVEEIYEILLENASEYELGMPDLMDGGGDDSSDDSSSSPGLGYPQGGAGEVNEKETESYWKEALEQAAVLERSKKAGKLPCFMERVIDEINRPQVDWRTYLWQFLIRTPTDFVGWDRRFIHNELYVDSLDGETVNVYVCIDTSGSISDKELTVFVSELVGILSAYPLTKVKLYYCAVELEGPYELEKHHQIPKSNVAGGTDFRPFFKEIEKETSNNDLAVYLTDGYGDFPDYLPTPTLWVLSSDGLDPKEIPLGEAVKLLVSAPRP